MFARRAVLSKERKELEAEEDMTGRLVTSLRPNSNAAEAYRTLRTNLLYGFVDKSPKVFVLTSPGPGEGKSTTCANLGVVLAQADKTTLILDCDFRRPTIHKFFGLHNAFGIMNVLVGERSLQEVWAEPIKGLKVVSVGPAPPNPAEVLSGKYFSEFLASLRQRFDYVLVDASPIGLVSDPAVLATQGDGVLLVLDAQKTRKSAVRKAVHSLDNVGVNVLGMIMSNVSVFGEDYYGNYRG